MVVAISIVLGIAALVVMAVAYASCIVAKETDEAMESQRVRVRRVALEIGHCAEQESIAGECSSVVNLPRLFCAHLHDPGIPWKSAGWLEFRQVRDTEAYDLPVLDGNRASLLCLLGDLPRRCIK